MSEPQHVDTLRGEDQDFDCDLPEAVLMVKWHDRQVQLVISPRGENWDWAVAEYVRTAKRMIRKAEHQEATRG